MPTRERAKRWQGPSATATGEVLRSPPSRLEWLDGVRAGAAFFVLLHHAWLAAFAARTFPVSDGPAMLTVLGYGHLAVAVFIVVSGFSLGLAPASHGRRLDAASSFARRRAWRILPPYWMALVVSLVVVTFVLGPGRVSGQTWRTLLVHGLLLQDIVPSEAPNGTFWSIAVESQIYVLFPLLVWVWRRWGARWVAATSTLIVVTAHVVGQAVPALNGVDNLTPQFLALFVFGMVAAGLVREGPSRPVAWPLAASCLAATSVGMGVIGLTRAVAAYFWLDLLVGALVAMAFVGLEARSPSGARSVLSSRPAVWLGRFSYSTYLTHAPVLALLWEFLVAPRGLTALPAFAVLLVVGVPVSYTVAYAFYLVAERPFLTIRSFAGLCATLPRPTMRRRETPRLTLDAEGRKP